MNYPNHRWHAKYPDMGTEPLSTDANLSQDIFDKQRDKIFKKVWLHVGRVERIAEPGEYFVADIAIAKASILVVHGRDGKIRGFHNVCTHRGNQLTYHETGKCRGYLTCPFHGWVFDTSGSLVNVPDADNFYDIDKSTLGLKPVRTEVWNNQIFICLDPEPEQGLLEYLGKPAELLADYPFQKFTRQYLWRTEVHSNWRLIADAQVESYHVAFLHSGSAQDTLTGKNNPYCHLLDYEQYDPHHVLSLGFNPEAQLSLVEGFAAQYGPSLFHGPGNSPLAAGLNPSRAENWNFDIFHLFPNYNILAFGGMYLTHQFWPVTVDTAVWEISVNFAEIETAAQLFAEEQMRANFRDAILEDGSTHEHTQRALESGAVTSVQLKDEEIALRHGYCMIDKYINEAA